MKLKKFASSLLFTFLFCQSSFLFAHHLSGGHVSYTCLGNNEFEIEFTIYRDCNSEGAPFDFELNVATYSGNSSTQNYVLVNSTFPEIGATDLLDPQECIINSEGICLEFARYSFVTSLPPSTDSYFFVHQRCCRRDDITNLTDSGDTGSTLFIELSPEAHASCNSSPVFNIANPVQVCLGEAFTIEDVYAVDSDADSVVYDLCKPFVGGGNAGTIDNPGDPSSCEGVMPSPVCPPPYSSVEYNAGYSEFEALGNGSTLNIDNLSGTISGIGQEIGDFIIGVCAKEYRNGVLLSSSIRDFVIEVQGLVSATEIEQTTWEVFPQPANEQIFIQTNNSLPKDAVLSIFNSMGQLVSKHRLDDTNIQHIDISQMNTGLYFYQIQKDGLNLGGGKLLKI